MDEEEEEASSDDDAVLMARALQSANVVEPPKKFIQMANDEPIDLDDSDDDEEENINETSNYKSDSDEFSIDNNVVGESDEEAVEIKEMLRFKSIRAANKVNLLLTKRIVKRSRNVFLRKKVERVKPSEEIKEKIADETEKTKEKPAEDDVKPMEVTEEEEKQGEVLLLEPQKPHTPAVSSPEVKPAVSPVSHLLPETKKPEESSSDAPEKTIESPLIAASALAEVTTSLLAEIQNAPIEEIFSRYVLKTSASSPTLDEFNEELFFCLQQNKLEIEKATQLWNEQLHVKYKIRELLETIRRHRAVMEIETFGKVPDNSCSNNNNHPVISSKSSTTTNSETDHYEKQLRMTSDSVSRLIQDVRASMLKRDESFNSVQQGRQGQIVDVQSIINDFRQKNPQEIPRRGRRMKGSFAYENQSSLDYSSNGHDFNSTAKSSGSGSGGYPEVSLHPVHNMYKNLGNVQAGPHFSGGHKSSLLQSILTKVS